MLKQILGYILLFLVLNIFSACRTTRVVDESIDELYQNCYEFIIEFESSTPSGFTEIVEEDELTDIFSDEALLAAISINQASALRSLIDEDEFAEFSKFKIYQNVLNKISLAELEVSSFASALRCEENKLTQLANFMDRKQSDRANTRTAAGIIIDATANVLSGGMIIWAISGNTFTQIMGVGASLTQIILNVSNKLITYKAEIESPTNLLIYVKEDDNEEERIPPHIWYYINNKKQIEGNTLREALIDSWMEVTIPEQQEIYFTNEGLFTIEQLQNKASMLEQFASNAEIMLQDLLKLRKEIDDFMDELGAFD